MKSTEIENIKNKYANDDMPCSEVLDLIGLLSNKTRFRILCLLRLGDFSVGEIVDIVQQGGISHTSQQLKLLSLAGLITRRKESRTTIVTLADERVRCLIDFLESTYMQEAINE